MDTRRLKHIQDVCPLYHKGALPSFEATHWASEVALSSKAVVEHPHGFTATVVSNPLITWYRTFTTNNRPERLPRRSFITIEEWVPSFEDHIEDKNWRTMGVPRLHGIAYLEASGSVDARWSTQAKRHLKTFQKQSDVTIRFGRLDELHMPYARSKIAKGMKATLWQMTERHIAKHPETIDVLIAESKEHGIVAAFVAGNCDEAKTSVYLLGFYLNEGAKAQTMTGLVHTWIDRSRTKGYKACNFGDMCGPSPLPFQKDRGYSIFKTHFGIHRVWLPKSYWKISFGR